MRLEFMKHTRNGLDKSRSVCSCGNDKHRDILVTDSDGYVRWTVAMFGNDKHRVILSDDEDDEVREEACSKREIQYWYPFL